MGIEPTLEAWEAAVLPLNYTREVFGIIRQAEPWRLFSAASPRLVFGQITMLLMEILLNGAAKTLAQPTTVAELIEQLGYTGKRIAVERNGDIVPKSLHATVALCAGDRLEIVVAVGGG